jgi:hypothetical protein
MSGVGSAVGALLAWLQTTAPAQWVAGSLQVTAALSAGHALAFTLVMGAAVVVNLRLLGWVLAERPPAETAGLADRLGAAGLMASIATGVLLFAGQATAVAANGFFQAKMLFLVAAVLFHVFVCRNMARRSVANAVLRRLVGACGLTLWLGLAVAACAFVLLE